DKTRGNLQRRLAGEKSGERLADRRGPGNERAGRRHQRRLRLVESDEIVDPARVQRLREQVVDVFGRACGHGGSSAKQGGIELDDTFMWSGFPPVKGRRESGARFNRRS